MNPPDGSTIEFSVTIPAFNEEKYLPLILESFRVARERYRNGPDAIEIIVADNTSTDATARVAAAGTEQVRLTVAGRATEVSGLPAGANGQAGAGTGTGAPAEADTVPFRLVFATTSTLAVDTPVQLDIDAEERTDTVLVPTEALVRDGNDVAVFVAADSRAERRGVKTGIEDAARTEIVDGVRAGELVITRGHVGLADGAAITVATDR